MLVLTRICRWLSLDMSEMQDFRSEWLTSCSLSSGRSVCLFFLKKTPRQQTHSITNMLATLDSQVTSLPVQPLSSYIPHLQCLTSPTSRPHTMRPNSNIVLKGVLTLQSDITLCDEITASRTLGSGQTITSLLPPRLLHG